MFFAIDCFPARSIDGTRKLAVMTCSTPDGFRLMFFVDQSEMLSNLLDIFLVISHFFTWDCCCSLRCCWSGCLLGKERSKNMTVCHPGRTPNQTGSRRLRFVLIPIDWTTVVMLLTKWRSGCCCRFSSRSTPDEYWSSSCRSWGLCRPGRNNLLGVRCKSIDRHPIECCLTR